MKTLAEYIEDMLLFKESIGYARKSYEYDLVRFRKFAEAKRLGLQTSTRKQSWTGVLDGKVSQQPEPEEEYSLSGNC